MSAAGLSTCSISSPATAYVGGSGPAIINGRRTWDFTVAQKNSTWRILLSSRPHQHRSPQRYVTGCRSEASKTRSRTVTVA